MARNNSSKKGGDTKRQEQQLQEQHNKLIESFRSLLSGEVSFLFPAMAGISHLNKLGAKVQAILLVVFLLMGYFNTVALILSHSTDAMRSSAVVSIMTLVVTVFCLGIFHLAIGLLTPVAYWGFLIFNFVLFPSGSLLIALRWQMFFQPPERGEKMPGEEVKGGDTKRHTNLQEHHNKLMESLFSLLSDEILFLFPAMVGISNLDKFGEANQAILLATFLIIGNIGIFHLAIGLVTLEAYQETCVLVNFSVFMCGSRLIVFLWKKFFQPPKPN